jgi:pyruvate-formate lyase-activating enzyme
MRGLDTISGSMDMKRRALERAQPLSAYLEITYACNWRCVFCYNPRHHDRRRLSLAEWEEVLDDLRALGTLNVTITGGEPLMHPEWLQVARAVKDRAFTLRLFTNGTLVSEPIADAIAALRPLAVEMSLHGATEETHDRATAKPGSHAALFAAIARLRSRGVPCVLKTVLTRLSEAELDLMIARTADMGVPYRLDVTLSSRDDGDRGPLAYAPSPEAVGPAPGRGTPAGRPQLRGRASDPGRRSRGRRVPLPAVAPHVSGQRAVDPASRPLAGVRGQAGGRGRGARGERQAGRGGRGGVTVPVLPRPRPPEHR